MYRLRRRKRRLTLQVLGPDSAVSPLRERWPPRRPAWRPGWRHHASHDHNAALQRPDHVGVCAYDARMSDEPRDAELAAQASEERLADMRARTSWDPGHDPDPVIRRMYLESQEQLGDELAQRKGA
jgi:hypothetical protein